MNHTIQPGFPEKLVGVDLLGLLTLGMYTDPLVVYREYIQNAADSISKSGARIGRVDIGIDPSTMQVMIQDDGPGLSHEQAVGQLVTIADSRKRRGIDRGFRGIGRLAGLAFAESVTFVTRQNGKGPVIRVRWDGAKLRSKLYGETTIEEAIHHSVTVDIDQDESGAYPEHFFRVEITGVARFAAGSMLNRTAVRNYIGEVCPVPFAPAFAERLSGILDDNQSLELEVFLNDEDSSVTRPHDSDMSISEIFSDCLKEIEPVTIPSLEGDGTAAAGWVAHSSYLGTLPKRSGIRGIRARDGNIQLGDESLFEHLFTEPRLNRWCVGEINILDPRIVPTSQRDYFEPGPHTRNLENHLKAVIRTLERRCRQASSLRNMVRRFRKILNEVDAVAAMAKSGYLTKVTKELVVDRMLQEIVLLRMGIEVSPDARGDIADLDTAEKKLTAIRGSNGRYPSLPGIRDSDAEVYRDIFSRLVHISPSPQAAKDTIEGILAHDS